MKKYIFVIVAIAIGAAVTLTLVEQGGAKVLNVKDVSSDPAAFTGVITITGITWEVSRQNPNIFGIMDITNKKELQCKTTCRKVLIPIKYQKQLPVIGDEVRVTGSFTTTGDKYLFVAENVEVVRHHQVGAK
jgi:hypothetical protein